MNSSILQSIKLTGILVALMSISALAQNQGGFQGGGGGGFRGGNVDPQQIQQMQNDAIKEALNASDEEWAVLGPKIQNIMQLQNASGGGLAGGMNAMMRIFSRQMANRNNPNGPQGNQGGQGFGRGGMPNIAQMLGIKDSVMQQRMEDLQTALQNDSTPEAIIKAKLDAVRQARDQARAKLDQARKDLIDLLTTRQEAVLFGMGILE